MEKESDFERFATLIVGELHAVEGRLNVRMDKADIEIAEVKLDLSEIKDELRSMRHELQDINKRIDHLEEQFGGIGDYPKELNELRARVKVLEEYMRKNAPATV